MKIMPTEMARTMLMNMKETAHIVFAARSVWLTHAATQSTVSRTGSPVALKYLSILIVEETYLDLFGSKYIHSPCRALECGRVQNCLRADLQSPSTNLDLSTFRLA